MQQRVQRCFSLLLYAAAAVGGIWLLGKFILPWSAPFLLAYALAALLEPLVKILVRRGWKRRFAAAILSLSLLALLIWLIVRLGTWGISGISEFARNSPELISAAGDTLARLEDRMQIFIAAAPEGVRAYLSSAMASVGDLIYTLPLKLSQWAIDFLGKAAQSSPDVLLFAVTAGVGTYFISASFPRTTAFISAQIPQHVKKRFEGLEKDVKSSFGGFFRAQLILMAMTFFELLLSFLCLDVEGAVGIAAVTALVDALPVFGTGIVLAPWALYSLLFGDFSRGIGLLIIWGIVNLVRSCAQAKLLGDQIGLEPLASLLAVYVGWRVWNVWGMLLFPLVLVTLQQLNDRGVIKLWKTP